MIANCNVNTKSAKNCVFENNRCKCETFDGPKEYDFMILIVTNSALEELKNSEDTTCISYGNSISSRQAVERY